MILKISYGKLILKVDKKKVKHSLMFRNKLIKEINFFNIFLFVKKTYNKLIITKKKWTYASFLNILSHP